MISQGKNLVTVRNAISEYKTFINHENSANIKPNEDKHTIVEITGISKPKRYDVTDYTAKCFAGNKAHNNQKNNYINKPTTGTVLDINV